MKRSARVACGALLLLSCAAQPQLPPSAHLWAELSGTLPGTWSATTSAGKTVQVRYRLVSGGSALIERWAPDTPRETLTVFHRDGEALIATHYCAQGNQPRLRLSEQSGQEAVFRRFDATDLAPEEGVLDELRIRIGAQRFEKTEVYQEGGERVSTVLRFVRTSTEP